MFNHERFYFRQLRYDLSSGLLFRPMLIILALSALAFGMTVQAAGGELAWLFPGEPSAAQLLLSTIASSMMTVVSVVYSILLVALSLASMQFSTRILRRFVRDQVSQVTLGMFLGTFLYCLLLLRVVRAEPRPMVPALGVGVAVVLAVLAMGWLVYFIHHIVQIIQANYLVDQLALESEEVIDQMFPAQASTPLQAPEGWRSWKAHAFMAPLSGYVQIVDNEALAELAKSTGGFCEVNVGIGHFAVQGTPLLTLWTNNSVSEQDKATALEAFDLGPVRTMQDDAEFGVRQIVDIALKAISPAVNDPSTAVTCIDHLGRLLVRIAQRTDPPHLLGLQSERTAYVLHETTNFRMMLDVACSQIRQYARTDMAVGLRLFRTLELVASVTKDRERRSHIARHAKLVENALLQNFPSEDCATLKERSERLHALVDAAT